MKYCIKYDDIRMLIQVSGAQFANWRDQLVGISTCILDITALSSFRGKAAESVKTYLNEIHISFIYAILETLSDFQSKLLLYSNGYYLIDADKYAVLPEEMLEQAVSRYEGIRSGFAYESDRVSSSMRSIRDIFYASAPSASAVLGGHDTFKARVNRLREDIGDFEQHKIRSHLIDLKNLIDALKATISEYQANPVGAITQYQTGDFTASANFAALYHQLQVHKEFGESHVDEIQTAVDNEKRVQTEIEQELAEQRKNDAIADAIVSGLIIIGGIAAIIATAGAATPLVVVAGVAGGVGSIAYGASNLAEAGQDIYYGATGDPYTSAFNPIRDTIFCGNQQAYDIFGSVSIAACAVSAPAAIGMNGAKQAGTSVVRAVTIQYAKGAVSAGAGYLGHEAGEALGLPEWANVLIGTGVGIGTGFGVEALDRNYNFSGYHAKTPQKIIKSVENGTTKLENNTQKGNYGEMKMDQYMEGKGYKRISLDRVTDLDSPTHKGIDGVYYDAGPPPRYIIGEAKYGSSKLSMTRDGKQMSKKWIRNRLEKAIGEEAFIQYQMDIVSYPDCRTDALFHVNTDLSVDLPAILNSIN